MRQRAQGLSSCISFIESVMRKVKICISSIYILLIHDHLKCSIRAMKDKSHKRRTLMWTDFVNSVKISRITLVKSPLNVNMQLCK